MDEKILFLGILILSIVAGLHAQEEGEGESPAEGEGAAGGDSTTPSPGGGNSTTGNGAVDLLGGNFIIYLTLCAFPSLFTALL